MHVSNLYSRSEYSQAFHDSLNKKIHYGQIPNDFYAPSVLIPVQAVSCKSYFP